MVRFVTASIIASVAAVAALAGTGAARAGQTAEPQFTDAQVLAAAYGASKTYAGAYSETLNGASLYYVNSNSARVGGFGGAWVELCSNSAAEARGWAAATNAFSSVQRAANGESQTPKFFEFRYDGTGGTVLMRVHKCAYAQPAADLLAGQPGDWGRYNGATNPKAQREFAEYQWFIRNYASPVGALMASSRGQGAGYDEWKLYTAEVTGQSFDANGIACDEVSLVMESVRTDRATDEVTINRTTLRTLQGLCQPPLGG